MKFSPTIPSASHQFGKALAIRRIRAPFPLPCSRVSLNHAVHRDGLFGATERSPFPMIHTYTQIDITNMKKRMTFFFFFFFCIAQSNTLALPKKAFLHLSVATPPKPLRKNLKSYAAGPNIPPCDPRWLALGG